MSANGEPTQVSHALVKKNMVRYTEKKVHQILQNYFRTNDYEG